MTANDVLLETCMEQCAACLQTCLELVARFRAGPIDPSAQLCILGLLDCAQTCEVAIRLIGRGSALEEEACALCGEACEVCAERLELAGGAAACAATCRECAATCFDVWRAGSGISLGAADRAGPMVEDPRLAFLEVSRR